MPFSRGGLPDPGMEPTSLVSPSLAGGFFTTSTTWEACFYHYVLLYSFVCLFVHCLSPYLWDISFRRTRFVHAIHSLIYEASQSAQHIADPQATTLNG